MKHTESFHNLDYEILQQETLVSLGEMGCYLVSAQVKN